MKTLSIIVLIILITAFTNLHAGLMELYKTGIIKLVPDPDFGKGVDWDSLFYEEHKDVVVSPDGSIFVFNTFQNNFFKFNVKGQLIGTFGQKGQGPGDFKSPGCHSILDGKFLVIKEYALNRRISIFDLSGKFVNIVKTKGSCYHPVGLKNNCIAYYSTITKVIGNPGSGTFNETITIFIRDLDDGKEITVDSFVLTRRVLRIGNGAYAPGNFLGDAFINKTGDGNLIVGVSNSPTMKIYSSKGKLLKTFQLNLEPVPVTGNYTEAVKNYAIKRIQERKMQTEMKKIMINKLKSSEYKKLFGEYLPFYGQVQVDSEGNILVFKWLECIENCDEVFQVYSPEGEYICETRIDDGIYDFEMRLNYHSIQFNDKGIFGLFKLANQDDTRMRLVNVTIK